MKRYYFFLIFLIFGCAQKSIKVDQKKEAETLFLSVKFEQQKQGVYKELVSVVQSKLKKTLAVSGYEVVLDNKYARYQLSLDFVQSEHKNPFLNENGLSMGDPFFHEIMITLLKNNVIILNKYPLLTLDFLTYPIDIHFRDWYSDVHIGEISQKIVDRILLLLDVWVKNA